MVRNYDEVFGEVAESSYEENVYFIERENAFDFAMGVVRTAAAYGSGIETPIALQIRLTATPEDDGEVETSYDSPATYIGIAAGPTKMAVGPGITQLVFRGVVEEVSGDAFLITGRRTVDVDEQVSQALTALLDPFARSSTVIMFGVEVTYEEIEE